MKILLDECITKRLKSYLTGFEVFTVSEMNWNGIKNLFYLCLPLRNKLISWENTKLTL
jgi:hypothetical protein